jgi:hypothetical protein
LNHETIEIGVTKGQIDAWSKEKTEEKKGQGEKKRLLNKFD